MPSSSTILLSHRRGFKKIPSPERLIVSELLTIASWLPGVKAGTNRATGDLTGYSPG